MVEREMDELALLWTQEGAPEEEQEQQLVRRLAERVGWRARLFRYADFGAAIAIAGGIALLVLMDGAGATGLSALLLVGAIGWTSWKRQALWDAEMSVGIGGGESMLDAARKSSEARLRRTNVSLIALLPAFALSLWFGFGLYEPNMDSLSELSAYMRADLERTILAFGGVALLFGWLLHSRRRLLRELRRIEAVREEYREEARLDARA